MLLVFAVLFGFTVEAAIGFGATLVTLSLGSLAVAPEELLPRVVPLNVLLSLAITVRAFRHVDARRLFLAILPAVLAGMPLGVLVLRLLPRHALTLALAAFLFVLAAVELVAAVRTTPEGARRLSRPASLAILFAGGVIHGAIASGGPPVVYVAARMFDDKAAFRATLSALWLLLGLSLVAVYAATGMLTKGTLEGSAALLPPVVAGIVLGDVLHARVPERAFKAVVFAMLLAVALLLAGRA